MFEYLQGAWNSISSASDLKYRCPSLSPISLDKAVKQKLRIRIEFLSLTSDKDITQYINKCNGEINLSQISAQSSRTTFETIGIHAVREKKFVAHNVVEDISFRIFMMYLRNFKPEHLGIVFTNLKVVAGDIILNTKYIDKEDKAVDLPMKTVIRMAWLFNSHDIIIKPLETGDIRKLQCLGYTVKQLNAIIQDKVKLKETGSLEFFYKGHGEIYVAINENKMIILVNGKSPLKYLIPYSSTELRDRFSGKTIKSFTMRGIKLAPYTSFSNAFLFDTLGTENVAVDISGISSDNIQSFYSTFRGKFSEIRLPSTGYYKSLCDLDSMFEYCSCTAPLDLRHLVVPRTIEVHDMLKALRTPLLIVNKGVSQKFIAEQGYQGRVIHRAKNEIIDIRREMNG